MKEMIYKVDVKVIGDWFLQFGIYKLENGQWRLMWHCATLSSVINDMESLVEQGATVIVNDDVRTAIEFVFYLKEKKGDN